MQTELKAIETEFMGYRFRSRLEARWALFMNELGIQFEYEKEGYELAEGRYLPDFYIPMFSGNGRGGYFLEVKGQPITLGSDEWQKAQRLAIQSNHEVFVFDGDPLDNSGLQFSTLRNGVVVWAMWFMCPICYRPQPGPDPGDLPCWCLIKNVEYGPLLLAAANKARAARFEFGEKG